ASGCQLLRGRACAQRRVTTAGTLPSWPERAARARSNHASLLVMVVSAASFACSSSKNKAPSAAVSNQGPSNTAAPEVSPAATPDSPTSTAAAASSSPASPSKPSQAMGSVTPSSPDASGGSSPSDDTSDATMPLGEASSGDATAPSAPPEEDTGPARDTDASEPADITRPAENTAEEPAPADPEPTADTSEPAPGDPASGSCTPSIATGTRAGGTGPHDVVVETNSDPGINEGTIFRPADLGGSEKYPIFVWGQGACSRNGLANATAMAEI